MEKITLISASSTNTSNGEGVVCFNDASTCEIQLANSDILVKCIYDGCAWAFLDWEHLFKHIEKDHLISEEAPISIKLLGSTTEDDEPDPMWNGVEIQVPLCSPQKIPVPEIIPQPVILPHTSVTPAFFLPPVGDTGVNLYIEPPKANNQIQVENLLPDAEPESEEMEEEEDDDEEDDVKMFNVSFTSDTSGADGLDNDDNVTYYYYSYAQEPESQSTEDGEPCSNLVLNIDMGDLIDSGFESELSNENDRECEDTACTTFLLNLNSTKRWSWDEAMRQTTWELLEGKLKLRDLLHDVPCCAPKGTKLPRGRGRRPLKDPYSEITLKNLLT